MKNFFILLFFVLYLTNKYYIKFNILKSILISNLILLKSFDNLLFF